MHTYVLTSFIVYVVSFVLVLIGIGLTKKVTVAQAFSMFVSVVWLIWAAVLLFGA